MINVFGGETVLQNGHLMGMTKPNLMGGSTFMDSTGQIVGNTAENLNGGVNMADANGSFEGFTTDNISGGSNIYDGTGSFDGFTTQFGDMATQFDASGGIETVLSGGTEMFGSLDLDPDSLMETMSTISDFI